ncbi:DUF1508 domain-containing protein [Acidobacteria bacterium ACD]|nr:DUF1508 domain-containing protein [Acidobacteria bacterium ACB2]MDL1948632.1 DUF1508 domain-containing protein [Acidobacteria bacterium ACD]
MASKFQLKKTRNGEFAFNLKAGNGEVILTSETYSAKPSAKNGIASVQRNAPDDSRYEPKMAKNGKAYFVLKALNGQVIGKSEMYETPKAMEAGIASVKKNAPGAKVEDLT